MPIYEYECEACAHRFDTLQKFSEAALTKCPECKKESLRKLISAAAFRLKGEGWYETDFKSGNKKNIAGGESSGDAGSSEKNAANSGDTKKSGTKSESSKGESKGKSESKTSPKSSSADNKASRG